MEIKKRNDKINRNKYFNIFIPPHITLGVCDTTWEKYKRYNVLSMLSGIKQYSVHEGTIYFSV